MDQQAEPQKEHWLAVRALFDQLVDLDPAQREAVLASADATPAVRAEVVALIEASDSSGDFFERSPTIAPLDRADAAHAHQPLAAGARLGPFRVEALLGRSGQGDVYRAVRVEGRFRQVVALRVLGRDVAQAFEHSQAERQVLARLDHPAIARLVDAGTTPAGHPYLAMEYIEGETITTYCAARKLDLAGRLALVIAVCDAVSHAHRNLLVHRDLKPANVRVTAEGQVKLLDLGVASLLTGSGEEVSAQAVLTADYAAPEQFEGPAATTAVDIHALGAMLFELLVGRPPWQLRNTPFAGPLRLMQDTSPLASAAIAQASAGSVPPARVAGDLDRIIQKAMHYEPGERYRSAAALRDDLQRHLDGRPVLAREGERLYGVRRFLRRRCWPLVALGLLLVPALVGTVMLLGQRRDTEIARQAGIVARERAMAVQGFIALQIRAAGSKGGSGFASAKRALDATASWASEQSGGDSRVSLPILAEVYTRLDDFETARRLLERVVSLSTMEGDMPASMAARQSLASALLSLERLDDADRELGQSKAFWTRDPKRHALEIAQARRIEASLLRQRGQRSQASALLREAIATFSATTDRRDEEIAALEHDLGVHYLESGALDDAEQSFIRADTLLGSDGRARSRTAAALLADRSNLALLRGDATAAEALLRQALEQRRVLDGPSAALAAMQLSLGRMLLASLRVDEGLALLDEALSFSAVFSGEASPTTIVLRQSRAIGLMASNRDREAALEIERALLGSRAAFGTGHIYYGLSLAARAQWRLRAGDTDGARGDLAALDAILARAGPAGLIHQPQALQLRERLDRAAGRRP